jgi:hypothetical protein
MGVTKLQHKQSTSAARPRRQGTHRTGFPDPYSAAPIIAASKQVIPSGITVRRRSQVFFDNIDPEPDIERDVLETAHHLYRNVPVPP